jgi:hypothetical protein
VIHLTEDDTTSSSRIFIKILFQVCGWVGGLAGGAEGAGLAAESVLGWVPVVLALRCLLDIKPAAASMLHSC